MKIIFSLITHLKIDIFLFKEKCIVANLLIYVKKYEWVLNVSEIIILELFKSIILWLLTSSRNKKYKNDR